jgi:hypothetical protein
MEEEQIECSNCGSKEPPLENCTNPFEPGRNIWLCERCKYVPFKYFNDKIKQKTLH